MIEKPNIAEEGSSSAIFGLSPRISETTPRMRVFWRCRMSDLRSAEDYRRFWMR